MNLKDYASEVVREIAKAGYGDNKYIKFMEEMAHVVETKYDLDKSNIPAVTSKSELKRLRKKA